MQLTQKESTLLKDLKGQEQLCIDKYTKHATAAKDSQLSALFTKLAGVEQHHLQMLTQIEGGSVPSPVQNSQPQTSFTTTYNTQNSEDKKNDQYLCTDLLTTEKHASSLYDTCIFEFKDPQTRNVLNSIQAEEQRHGEEIYKYMQANSMYS